MDRVVAMCRIGRVALLTSVRVVWGHDVMSNSFTCLHRLGLMIVVLRTETWDVSDPSAKCPLVSIVLMKSALAPYTLET